MEMVTFVSLAGNSKRHKWKCQLPTCWQWIKEFLTACVGVSSVSRMICFFGCDLNTPREAPKPKRQLSPSLTPRRRGCLECWEERIPWQDQIFLPLLQWRQVSTLQSTTTTRQMSLSIPRAVSPYLPTSNKCKRRKQSHCKADQEEEFTLKRSKKKVR